MHVVARVLAVAYVVLGVAGAIIYVQTSVNYVNMTEINLNIEDHAGVTHVEVHWSGDSSDIPRVRVWFNVTNPGRVSIEVTNIDFTLHMDDPEDARPWNDNAKLDETRISPGGFTYSRGQGILVGPGQTVPMSAEVPVEGPERFARFNQTDAYDRYHPIVWSPRLAYTFPGFDITPLLVFLSPYHEVQGVLPRG